MIENNANQPQTAIEAITRRAAIILSLLLLLTTISAAGAVYTGSESGELRSGVIAPLNRVLSNAAQTIGESFGGGGESLSDQPPQADTSSEVKVETNIEIETGGAAGVGPEAGQTGEGYQIRWVYPSLPSNGNYEETRKSYDEWWEDIQEQNRNASEQSKQDLEKFQQESRQRLEEFKLQGQQGMEEFRQDMERKQQEFLQQHGIEP